MIYEPECAAGAPHLARLVATDEELAGPCPDSQMTGPTVPTRAAALHRVALAPPLTHGWSSGRGSGAHWGKA